MTPSKTLFYFCVSFVLGIFLESLAYNWSSEYIKSRALYVVLGFLVLGVAIIFLSLLVKKYNIAIAGFCVLFLVLGIMRFQISEFAIENSVLKSVNDKPLVVTLQGVVSGEADMRNNFKKITVTVQKLIVGTQQIPAHGGVLVTLGLYKNYSYLDQVEVTGKLKTPNIFDDFNYKNYLLKDGVYSLLYYPKIVNLGQIHDYNPFTFLYGKILYEILFIPVFLGRKNYY